MLTALRPLVVVTAFVLEIPPVAEQDDTQVLPPPPAVYAPTTEPDAAEVEIAILERTNELRGEQRLRQLKPEPQLQKTARTFAEYMARTRRYGHEADGKRPAARAEKQGYNPCLLDENIAYAFGSRGFTSEELAKDFFEGWQASPGHRRNLLDPDVTETAVAIAQSDDGYFFAVHLFGRPRSQAVTVQLTNESGVPFEYEMGAEKFELLPQQMRTHQACRPQDLEFSWHDRDTEKQDAEKQTVSPMTGERYVVVKEGDRVRVRKK